MKDSERIRLMKESQSETLKPDQTEKGEQSTMNTKIELHESTMSNTVFITQDHDQFKHSKFNRNINLTPYQLESFKKGIIAPIIVNEDLVVIDGQHRLEAAKQMKKPIEYIVIRGLDEKDIIEMNTVVAKWTLMDYIDSYANKGLSDYKDLRGLIKAYEFSPALTANLAGITTLSVDSKRKDIEHGTFKIFDYDVTDDFLYELAILQTAFDINLNTTAIESLFRLYEYETFDFERLYKKITQSQSHNQLEMKFDRRDQLENIISIYNFGFSANSKNIFSFKRGPKNEMTITEPLKEWAKKLTTK